MQMDKNNTVVAEKGDELSKAGAQTGADGLDPVRHLCFGQRPGEDTSGLQPSQGSKGKQGSELGASGDDRATEAAKLGLPVIDLKDSIAECSGEKRNAGDSNKKQGAQTEKPTKEGLKDMISATPALANDKGREKEDERQKAIIDGFSDAELKTIGDLTSAFKNGDIAGIGKTIQQFAKNPERLGEMFDSIKMYMNNMGVDFNKNSLSYGTNGGVGTLSMQMDSEPHRYLRTDGKSGG